MKRWNGWGHEADDYPLTPEALGFLGARIGGGAPPHDAGLETALRTVPASRLDGAGFDTGAEAREQRGLVEVHQPIEFLE